MFKNNSRFSSEADQIFSLRIMGGKESTAAAEGMCSILTEAA